MSLLVNFNDAAAENSGFAAEQVLFNRGFYEIGRRTDAAAWTTANGPQVIRISRDATGSEQYFALAQKMSGNPYMPVVFDQKTLPSGDHIVCVEKLYSPLHDFARLKTIRDRQLEGRIVDQIDLNWKAETEERAVECKRISDIFMNPSRSTYDISTLPEPQAFKEASVAMLELSAEMHKKDRRYFPSVDFNPSNVMWRPEGVKMQPVLYDPISRQYDIGMTERVHTDLVRAKFGMAPIPTIMTNHGPI